MKQLSALTVLCAVALLAGAASPARGLMLASDWDDYSERDEIRQTVALAPGAEVRVSDISGPVVVETTGGGEAEIHVVRSARSREELERRKILIEQTASGLSISTARDSMRRGSNVRQQVTLRVPRHINLAISDVAGQVRVGDVDGTLRVSDVAGRLEVGSVTGSPHISDIAGSVTVAVVSVGEQGIHITDVAGRVELTISQAVDADILVEDISGPINMEVPAVALGKISPDRFEGRLGNGGPQIAINDVAGPVTVRGAQ